jgi:hypothetical protein
MILEGKQKLFLDQLLNLALWQDPGWDRFKVTHRRDCRIQVSWRYRRHDKDAPYTISDNEDFMYLTKADLGQVYCCLVEGLKQTGVIKI